ncbi:MAG: hypothetical protein CVU50_06685 [Candidatus Cloacimonetes bacterium HGW-Cloacimonetes-3]|jgi:REP element-mobilizing transposase RayT|nr:MAG: hypothetical protein CVU50_06685 [Candidatus Cloacimonetes bacterium HGW-Cloacimonetes-3]
MPILVEQHRRFLPHFQAAEQIIALSWRLAFTLPGHMIAIKEEMGEMLNDLHRQKDSIQKHQQLQAYTKRHEEYDFFLSKCQLSDLSLCEPGIAAMLCTAFKFYDTKLYNLHAYCVMPNHIHLLIKPLPVANGEYCKQSTIVQRLKSYTAKEINHVHNRQGKVWNDDYFDRYTRNEDDYNNVVNYILYNPVKAGLAQQIEDWKYSYYYRMEMLQK